MIVSHALHDRELDNFILVHTMGKVGSTALVQSLEAVNIAARHLQWLSPDTQTFFDRTFVVGPRLGNDFDYVLNRLNVTRAFRALSDSDYASLIKVITAIRAPIESILSHCFHGVSLFSWQLQREHKTLNANNLRDLISRYVFEYMRKKERTTADLTRDLRAENYCETVFCWTVFNYINWFDVEFVPFFKAAVLDGPMKEGYQIVGNALILRFEDLHPHGERAVAAYAQRPHFKLLRENVGADKTYGELYQELIQTIRFPRAFVDHLCDSKYVRHFYSEEERQKMRDRWTQ